MTELEKFIRGTTQVIGLDSLKEKLSSREQLNIKIGADPTSPNLHLGHAVLLRKLRVLQEMGHKVTFIIGDFTARIGDPSGRDRTRPILTKEEIDANANLFKAQVLKILIEDNTTFLFNSNWLGQLNFSDVVSLASKTTVAQMLERSDFKSRFESKTPISLHEFLYPLAQAFDSVHCKPDIEIGGTDQLFNLMLGRSMMKDHGLSEQVVITMPIIEGLDAVPSGLGVTGPKMSKSLNNDISLALSPNDMFGKLMSICDPLMWKFFPLLTDFTDEEIQKFKNIHPKDAKVAMASNIVSLIHSEDAALAAERFFNNNHVDRIVSEQIQTFTFSSSTRLFELISECGFAESKSAARRLIRQGAVDIDNKKVENEFALLVPGMFILKVGKKNFGKVVIRD